MAVGAIWISAAVEDLQTLGNHCDCQETGEKAYVCPDKMSSLVKTVIIPPWLDRSLRLLQEASWHVTRMGLFMEEEKQSGVLL